MVSVNQSNTTEILHVGTFAGHIGHGLSRPLWWKGYRSRVRPLRGSPKVPSGTMTVLCIYYAPITGYSRFTRNYCTHRPAAMPPGNVKENDPAVAWHGLQHMPNHPNSIGRRLLARASVTGLEVPVRRIPYRYGFLHWAPVVLQQLQKKEDKYRAEHPS